MDSSLVTEHIAFVAKDKIALRLHRYDENFVLKRETLQPDGTRVTQVFPVEDNRSLWSYIHADPYLYELENRYRQIKEVYSVALNRSGRQSASASFYRRAADDLMVSCEQVHECHNHWEIHSVVGDLIHRLGGTQYVYSSITYDEIGAVPMEYEYLIGCHPRWLQTYQHRHWYANDPFIEYAKNHTRPIVGSKVSVASGGQQQMLSAAKEFGFCSQLVAPASVRHSRMIGMLHVGSSIDPADGGEAQLLAGQILFRALSAELLDREMCTRQRSATTQFDLSEREILVLRLVRDAESAWGIAGQLGLSVHTVYAIYGRINEKLGAGRITESAKLAAAHGLVR
ncbi:autoinducer binding domain-containing protein [Paraburkholderia tropica]|uniref:helix-turn-helix transcriptional regulator n=1 Tax=Paraburkholderia tropica TaxID=92647 RepID=UPI0032B412A6